tara:strand:- start:645 stop:830 length:186 start_codon:yes stop_codon:yes gene_type:complete
MQAPFYRILKKLIESRFFKILKVSEGSVKHLPSPGIDMSPSNRFVLKPFYPPLQKGFGCSG